MAGLIWSPRALADIQRLYRFLASKNPAAARRAVTAIRSSVRILARHPAVGRGVEGLDTGFREWPVAFGASGYRIFYRFTDPDVVILAVRHMKEAGHDPEGPTTD